MPSVTRVAMATIDAARRLSVRSQLASALSLGFPASAGLMLTVRLATAADLEAINAIYNHYVATSPTMYDDEPTSLEERRQSFESRPPIHPLTVACLTDASGEKIVGYGSLHTFRGKRGYRFVVENSVYVHPDHHRRGIG